MKKSGTLLSLEEIIFADISDTLQNCVPLLLDLLTKSTVLFDPNKKDRQR